LCESVLPVAPERVNVDPFHRAPVSLVVLVHPATSARPSQIDPVRRPVTGAAKLRIYKRLQKQRLIAVNALPVRRQLPRTQGENSARQIPHLHPGQYQKPRVVYHECRLRDRSSLVQPIQLSRAAIFQAGLDRNSQANTCFTEPERTRYLKISPD
jgi:hypothetical protein